MVIPAVVDHREGVLDEGTREDPDDGESSSHPMDMGPPKVRAQSTLTWSETANSVDP